jgi:formylglycine-generating enzyme required for sulfatase activity
MGRTEALRLVTLPALALGVWLAGCSDPDVAGTRWQCQTDDDCGSGWVCGGDGYCAKADGGGEPDTSRPPEDVRADDVRPTDTRDASQPPEDVRADDGGGGLCGNGRPDPFEACERGESVACAEVGAYASGTAVCAADCGRWETDGCVAAGCTGECAAGDAPQSEGCATCGTRTRVCRPDCTWGPWSACEEPACCRDADCGTDERCASGVCVERCECSPGSGPCCDGCRFRPVTAVCATGEEELGCPDGTDCGSPQKVRTRDRTCSGRSVGCSGDYGPWSAWELAVPCSETERCYETDGCVYAPECDALPCGSVRCPELAGFTVSCNVETAHCEYRRGGSAVKERRWVLVEPGTFQMGSPTNEPGYQGNETRHAVVLTRRFLLQATEVTQGQWRAVLGTNPSGFSSCGDACPVEQVSWWGAVAYCNALSAAEGLEECYTLSGCSGTAGDGGYSCTGVTFAGLACGGYRLPTEAEWEYAYRAGTTTAFWSGGYQNPSDPYSCAEPALDAIAWYCGNSGDATHPVGGRAPNGWGLYDVAGNVWEWVWDWYGDYPTAQVTDPRGPASGASRVYRGGSWSGVAGLCRAADRFFVEPGARYVALGFRPSRSLP